MGQKWSCCRINWAIGAGHLNNDSHRNNNGSVSHHNHGLIDDNKFYPLANDLSDSNTRLSKWPGDDGHGWFESSWSSVYGHTNKLGSFMSVSHEKLQHITEREPDDNELDPSLNAAKETLFLKRSKKVIEQYRKKRYSMYDRRVCHRYLNKMSHRWHFSSCSSIFLDDCTVSQPNGKICLKALALAVYFHIQNRDSSVAYSPENYEIFDEKRHPIDKAPIAPDYAVRNPDQREIYRFIRNLFTMAQLTSECSIVAMVYIERLLSYAEMDLFPATWRRQLLGSILLASKVWDDQAVWNVDYCNILKDLPVEDVNDMERQYLELIQFNINIPPSVYTKYYLDMLSLAEAHGLYNTPECRRPLSKDRARRLEALGTAVNDPFYEWTKPARGIPRFPSVESFFSTPRFRRAIIS